MTNVRSVGSVAARWPRGRVQVSSEIVERVRHLSQHVLGTCLLTIDPIDPVRDAREGAGASSVVEAVQHSLHGGGEVFLEGTRHMGQRFSAEGMPQLSRVGRAQLALRHHHQSLVPDYRPIERLCCGQEPEDVLVVDDGIHDEDRASSWLGAGNRDPDIDPPGRLDGDRVVAAEVPQVVLQHAPHRGFQVRSAPGYVFSCIGVYHVW
ncbi:MAG: hypothetical protein ACR2GH_11880 [Pseudonocardia sp.]